MRRFQTWTVSNLNVNVNGVIVAAEFNLAIIIKDSDLHDLTHPDVA